MKKVRIVVFGLILCVLLAGCARIADLSMPELPAGVQRILDKVFPGEEDVSGGVLIYRIASSEDEERRELIQSETLPLPEDANSEIDGVLELFGSPSRRVGLSCALTDGVTVVSWSRENRGLTLEFSEEFLAAPPMDRTQMAFCAALTLCELDGVENVTVTAGGQTLFSGLVPEDALLSDSDTDPYVRQLRLYFTDGQGRYLISEYHTLTLDEDSSPERYVVEELLRGPNSTELKSPIPAGTSLVSCATVDGVCVVNLSEEFYENRPETALGERLAIYSIVNSLTALSGVDSVNLLVEGKAVDTYVFRSLAEPMSWYDEVIAPAAAAQEELDANLYLVTPDFLSITELPFRVELANYESQAEAVLAALLTAAEPGYPALFSGSGSVTDITVQGSFCTVDLSESFFASLPSEARSAAVQSIAATLCDLADISAVAFTISGASAVYEGTDWSGPWSNFTEIEVQ